MHEILGSISQHYAHSIFGFAEYVPVCTEYILVHTCKVLELQVQTGMCSVGTVPQWYILRYRTKSRELLCSSKYLLVMHLTILAKSTFRFGTRYIWICTASCSEQIQMYRVPNRNVDFARIVRCITRRYKEVCTATDQYKLFHTIPEYIPLQHCVIPSMHIVCTPKKTE
jgi:hypothetical protein